MMQAQPDVGNIPDLFSGRPPGRSSSQPLAPYRLLRLSHTTCLEQQRANS